jgi:hypothetical protein
MFIQNIRDENTGIYVFFGMIFKEIIKLPGRETERIFQLVLFRSHWNLDVV